MKNLKRSTLREIQEKYVAGDFDRRDEQRVRRVVWVKNTTGSAIPARSAIQLDGWTSRDVFIGVAPTNPIKTAITLDRIPAGKVGRAKIDLFFANLTNATNATYATAALVGQTTSDGAAFAVVALDGNFAALVRFNPSGGGGTAVTVLKSITTSTRSVLTEVEPHYKRFCLAFTNTPSEGIQVLTMGNDGTPQARYITIVESQSSNVGIKLVTNVTGSGRSVLSAIETTDVDVVKYE